MPATVGPLGERPPAFAGLFCNVHATATCLTWPAASQMLDPVPAGADSDHELSTFWRMFDEDLLFPIEHWRPFHYGKDTPLDVTKNAKSLS